MKKFCFFVLLACALTGRLLANGIPDVSHLPGPDVKIELPPELIGIFEFVFEDPYMRYFFGEIDVLPVNFKRLIPESGTHIWISEIRGIDNTH